jgi:hypothetical protein
MDPERSEPMETASASEETEECEETEMGVVEDIKQILEDVELIKTHIERLTGLLTVEKITAVQNTPTPSLTDDDNDEDEPPDMYQFM